MFNEKRKSWEYSEEDVIKLGKEVESDLQNFLASRSRWKAMILAEKEKEKLSVNHHIVFSELNAQRLEIGDFDKEQDLEKTFEELVFLSNGSIQIAVNILFFIFTEHSFTDKQYAIIQYLQKKCANCTRKGKRND